MKRLKRFLIITASALLLTGCKENTNFVTVHKYWTYKVVYNKDTKVMYTVSSGVNNQGNFTLLVNPDGTPQLYEGDNDD